MKILIVDDQVLFREGLVSLFNGRPDFEVVGEASGVRQAIELSRTLKPDVILIDFLLPDGNGLDATNAILKDRPDTMIVFLTTHDEDERLFAAIRSGAKGYLHKNLPISKLILSLEALERGEVAVSRTMTARIVKKFAETRPEQVTIPAEMAKLTPREVEVLKVLETGATNREIAGLLFISERTVKNHVSNILGKLNLKNRAEAANYARRHGLLGENKH